MNGIFRVFVSLSASGSLLILFLLLAGPLLKNRLSRRWQYYIWLIVIARLLLPLSPEVSLMGAVFREPVRAAVSVPAADAVALPAVPAGDVVLPPEDESAPSWEIGGALRQNLWAIWLGAAALLLLRKITVYQSFGRYIRAGCTEVSDVARLDCLGELCGEMGVHRPIELYENRLASSPMLLGFFRPCIVLPDAGLPDDDLRYTLRHELTHYRRRDLLYKWLVQATVCLHWFNPLVWWMGREISRACELACDEAVLRSLEPQQRRAYGDMLLRATAAGGGYGDSAGSVTLHESGELLKERLRAIMNFKKNSRIVTAVSFLLAAVLLLGGAAAGAYTGAAVPNAGKGGPSAAYRRYQEGDIAGFSAAYVMLDEAAQRKYLNLCYEDGSIAYYGACMNCLPQDSPLFAEFAEKAYADEKIAFFSIPINRMSQSDREAWADRAVEDKRLAFSAMLANAAGTERVQQETDKLTAEREKQLLEEYKAYGITKSGWNYYYQGKLTRVFADFQANESFVTLNTNPKGTVSVKVTRNADGSIKTVGYLTESEIDEMFGDDFEEDEWDDPVDEDTIVNISREDLPEAARKAMQNCAVRKWYLIHAGERQYIYCNGFAWSFGYEPELSDGKWTVDIVRFRKKDSGYVLLSLPEGAPVSITCDGEAVALTEIK